MDARHHLSERAGERHEVDLEVGPVEVAARPHIAAAVDDAAGQHTLAAEQVAERLDGEARQAPHRQCEAGPAAVGGHHDDAGMVLEVAADPRQCDARRDAVSDQHRRVADPRQHQDLRRIDCAGTEHDFPARADRAYLIALPHLDPHGAAILDRHLQHRRVSHQRQVRPVDDGIEEGARAAQPLAAALVEMMKAETLGQRPVEVVAAVEPGLARGVEKGAGEAVRLPDPLDTQLAAGAVPRPGAIGEILVAQEEWQHVVPRPAAVAELRPVVVVGGLAPRVDHAVDGARAADDSTAWAGDDPASAVALVDQLVVPVGRAPGEEIHHPRRHGREQPQPRRGRGGPRLDQAHADCRVRGKPVRQHAPRRPGADDHIVEWGVEAHAVTAATSSTGRAG